MTTIQVQPEELLKQYLENTSQDKLKEDYKELMKDYKEIIQVQITEEGRAREVNKYSKPIRSQMSGLMYAKKMVAYNRYKSKLRIFTIENVIVNAQGEDCYFKPCSLIAGEKWGFIKLEPGSQHTAEIIDSEKLILRIIS